VINMDSRTASSGCSHRETERTRRCRLKLLLEPSPYADDGGNLIGRDPRKVSAEEWQGTPGLVGLKAIRAKCLDCAYIPSEVRKCVQTGCPLWPLRMGCVPKGFKIARMEASTSDDTDSGSATQLGSEPNEKPAHEPDFDAEDGA